MERLRSAITGFCASVATPSSRAVEKSVSAIASRKYLSNLAFMLAVEILLSLLFNLFCAVRVIPSSERSYFIALTLFMIAFMIIIGIRLRKERLRLVKKVEHRSRKDSAAGEEYAAAYEKKYYADSLIACALFAVIVYLTRELFGKRVFRWLFAITNFANFTGVGNNVHVAVAIFFTVLVLNVFIAQLGVAGKREKKLQERHDYYKMRKEIAQKRSEMARVENAGDVDVLGAVAKRRHRHHKR